MNNIPEFESPYFSKKGSKKAIEKILEDNSEHIYSARDLTSQDIETLRPMLTIRLNGFSIRTFKGTVNTNQLLNNTNIIWDMLKIICPSEVFDIETLRVKIIVLEYFLKQKVRKFYDTHFQLIPGTVLSTKHLEGYTVTGVNPETKKIKFILPDGATKNSFEAIAVYSLIQGIDIYT